MRKRVLIVDDQRTASELMRIAVEESENYVVENIITDAGNAYFHCMSGRIDIILMDVYTLEGANGIEAAAKIKKDFPDIKIIIVTSMPEEDFIRGAKDAKCDSFWYKDISEESLISVMDKTIGGESVYPSQSPVVNIGHAQSSDFTKRELEVMRALINGLSQKEIADAFGIKYASVRSHVTNILNKTGYDSPSRLIAEVASKSFMIPGSR